METFWIECVDGVDAEVFAYLLCDDLKSKGQFTFRNCSSAWMKGENGRQTIFIDCANEQSASVLADTLDSSSDVWNWGYDRQE